ncbi:hypothetical protein ACILE2_09270 [Capnocytophaga canimorsus]|uniref:hypothetical protein n=1 Tax=Capnocytophaga canimorsus TaxID=28188 RepID=UPI0037D60359
MAQTINIIDLDINIGALIQKAQESKQSVYNLAQEVRNLKAEQATAEKQIAHYTKRLAYYEKAGASASKEAEHFRQVLASAQATIAENNKKLVEAEAKLKTNQTEYRTYSNVIQAYSDKVNRSTQGISQHNGSLNQISAALSHNKALYKDLTKEERENAEIGGKLLKLIEQQDKEYKKLHKSIGNTQVEVGNYKESVKQAINESFNLQQSTTALLGPFGSLSPLIVSGIKGLYGWATANKAAEVASTGTTKALKILKLAFIGTGIGAIVVLLGSLIAYLTSTQEGANKLTSALTPLKEIFATLWGVLQQVGKALFEAFSKTTIVKDFGNLIKNFILLPLNQAIGVVKSLGKVLNGDLKGAWNELKAPTENLVKSIKDVAKLGKEAGKQIAGAFDGFGDKMKDAWERGKKIAELEKELREFNIDYKRQTSELNRMYKEQQQILEDTTKSESERQQAGRRAIEIQNQINALAEKRNGLEVDLITLKQQANDTDDAGKQELQDKLAELEDERAERIKKITTTQNKINSINKEAQQKRKEQLRKSLEEEKKLIDDYLASGSGVAKSLDERLKLEKKAKGDRLAVLEKEKIAGIKTFQEYQREKQQIENEYLNTRAELTIENFSNELSLYISQNQSKIQNETRLTAELVAEEQARQEAIYQKKLEALEKEKQLKTEAHQWGYVQEQEYQLALINLNNEREENRKALDKDFQQQQKDEKKRLQALDLEERITTLKEEKAYEQDIQREIVLNQHQTEVDDLTEKLAKQEISVDEYNRHIVLAEKNKNQALQMLDDAKRQAQMENMQSVLGGAKEIFGEHTAIGKAAAIAEATINTYLGVSKAIASYPPPYSTIMAAVALGTGLKNVQKIMSVKTDKKARRGIVLKGNSHEAGGIDLYDQHGNHVVEAEGDENIYVLNKRASKEIAALSLVNERTGGIPLTTPTSFARAGGLVGRTITQSSSVDFNFNPTEFAQVVAPILAESVKEGAGIGTFQGANAGTLQGTTKGIIQNGKTIQQNNYE